MVELLSKYPKKKTDLRVLQEFLIVKIMVPLLYKRVKKKENHATVRYNIT